MELNFAVLYRIQLGRQFGWSNEGNLGGVMLGRQFGWSDVG